MVTRADAITLFNKGCEAVAAARHLEAADYFRQALLIEPGSLMARYNLGCSLRDSGDAKGAVSVFAECANDHPDHPHSLHNLAACFEASGQLRAAIHTYRSCTVKFPDYRPSAFQLAVVLGKVGDNAGAMAAYRACAERHPDNPDAGYNLSGLLIESQEYDEAVQLLDALHRRFPLNERVTQNRAMVRWRLRLRQTAAGSEGFRRLLVACMPKSGSTFLADVLAKLPGMQRAHLVPDYGRREQELDLEQLISHQGLSYVSQLHLRPSKLTRELLTAFALRPVFLFRNIWDVMASLRDHMHTHSLDWSMAQIDPDFRNWEEGRQYEFLARTMMPWFVDFYVAWSREPDRLAVRYEDLMADPVAEIGRIAAWAGLAAGPEEIVSALAAVGHSATFNQGGSGRGAAVPAAARAHVEALAGFYPDVDFGPLTGVS